MGSFLTEVEGFTPVIDAVVRDVGMMPALVYGVVFRHCEMRLGVCQASVQTIADKVGINRRTALRHLKLLCEKGYLEDTTPHLKNRPHTYANTGKVKIQGLLSTVTESHCESDTESQQGDRESPPGVTESHLKIHDTKEDTNNKQGCENTQPATFQQGALTVGQKEFLVLFGGKRFKNNVQRDTVLELEKEYGTKKLLELGVWAAKNGMSVGRAVVAVEGALKKQSGNGRRKVIKVSET